VLLFGLWLELAALIAVVIHRGTSIGLRMQSALRQQDACRHGPTTPADKARWRAVFSAAGSSPGILRCDDLCRAEM